MYGPWAFLLILVVPPRRIRNDQRRGRLLHIPLQHHTELVLLQLRYNMTGIYINETDLGCYRSDVDCVIGIGEDALANNFDDL